jgi:hypothetical protein
MQTATVYHRGNQIKNFKQLLVLTPHLYKPNNPYKRLNLLPVLTGRFGARVGMIFVKIESDNRIDLKWTGIKGPNSNHYNVYIDTKPSFKVLPGVTVPSGTSNTNSYSSTGLNPSARYYCKIAAVDDAKNIGPLSNTKSGMTKGVAS